MSIIKQYLKKRPICKVTFRIPKENSETVNQVHVVGDFNGWDPQATPMKKMKNGVFEATIDLDMYKEYQFRYLKDDGLWENENDADKYVRSPYGTDNSVIIV